MSADRAAVGGVDEAEFERVVAPHQRALLAHCYRMTGSLADAEDALQETLIRAWRAYGSFEGRSSLRTWLFRIATNACRRLLEQRQRRILPVDFGPAHDPHGVRPGVVEEDVWLTPFPGTPPASPAAKYESRESVELAFVAALQTLPSRQRAALLLRDVLGFSAAETADALETSVASANSALSRARRAMEERTPEPAPVDDANDRALVERFVEAWVRNDVADIVTLLAEDVEMTMPPMAQWYRGLADVTAFLGVAPLAGRLGWRSRPVEVNGRPGFALYSSDGTTPYVAHSLNLLTSRESRVTGIHAFLTTDLFAAFGLPEALDD
ncbi:MAG: RNA polymerase subunit sigma-70 [Nocardioides sp.]